MKDGKIKEQGTFQDIQERNPELYNQWQDAVRKASESESTIASSGDESDDIREEREELKRQVAKQNSEADLETQIEKGKVICWSKKGFNKSN